MLVVDAGDFCKVLRFRAVFLHVFTPSVAEELRRTGRVRYPSGRFQHGVRGAGRVFAVVEVGLEAAGRHLLESDDEDAVGGAVRDGLAGHVETGAPCRAVVVDVVDGDLGHAELVEDSLATGRIAIAVARHSLVDLVVVDLRVQHCLHAGFEAEFMVVDLSSWLDEFGHSYAEDIGGRGFARHDGGARWTRRACCLFNYGRWGFFVMAFMSRYTMVVGG